jgi:hypothetical protein
VNLIQKLSYSSLEADTETGGCSQYNFRLGGPEGCELKDFRGQLVESSWSW